MLHRAGAGEMGFMHLLACRCQQRYDEHQLIIRRWAYASHTPTAYDWKVKYEDDAGEHAGVISVCVGILISAIINKARYLACEKPDIFNRLYSRQQLHNELMMIRI